MKETRTYRDYEIEISIEADEGIGMPWVEHDGHGKISQWKSRKKMPGERILHSDRRYHLYYDWQATMEVAKRDGWGLCDEDKAKFAKKLGRVPTRNEIVAEAVQRDFDYCREFATGERCWLYYSTTIVTPDGGRIQGDSLGGIDDLSYAVSEAYDNTKHQIDELIETERETALAEVYP